MSTELIKEFDENLKLQIAMLVSTNLMLGALISVLPEEQYLKLARLYVLDAQQYNANLLASTRPDAEEWGELMDKAQQQFFAVIAGMRVQHNPSEA